jgi:hypothetical protein
MRNLDICDYNSLHFLSKSKLKIILKPYFKKTTPTIKNQKPQLQVKKLHKYFRVQSLSF